MSDRIEGIAILNDQVSPAWLFFVCVRESGDREPWSSMIPVCRTGSPNPDGVAWIFDVAGEELRVSPSAKISDVIGYDETTNPPKPILREIFHNPGAWSVRFVTWTGPARDADACYSRLRELNPSLLTPRA